MKKLIWLFTVTGTVIMVVVMSVTGKPLKTDITPKGIIDLELANSKPAVQEIITAWQSRTVNNTTLIEAAVRNTCFDFLFIFFYTSFFFLACRALAKSFRAGSILNIAGRVLAGMSIASAGLDVAENFGMLRSLKGNITNNIALFTATSSASKWIIVLLTVLYLILGLSAFLIGKAAAKRPE